VTSGSPAERTAFARELLASDLSAAAYQMEVSTNRLMRTASSLRAPEVKASASMAPLFAADIEPSEAPGRRPPPDRPPVARLRVARDEAPDVFGEGYAQIAGTLARPALELRLDHDLRT